MASKSAGLLLREAVKANKPLQVVGAINAYAAILAEKTGTSNDHALRAHYITHTAHTHTPTSHAHITAHVGHKALYLSGSGVAAASFGFVLLTTTVVGHASDTITLQFA